MEVFARANKSSEFWYLVHCKPRREAFAANALRSLLKLFVFLPESLVKANGKVKAAPFFPGYIFIKGDLQKVPVSQINACPGVLRLVAFGNDPQPVSPHIIETLSERLAASRQQFHAQSDFRPGDRVQVKHGPMQDLEMIFVESLTPNKRVCVLLNILGRMKKVQLEADMLEKATVLPGQSSA